MCAVCSWRCRVGRRVSDRRGCPRTDVPLPEEGPNTAYRAPRGTLNAIDLNAGTIRWKIPFCEFPDLAAKGLKSTGSDNNGVSVVTAGGLLFIGATNFDKEFHAYDRLTGELLWETTLPAAGNATPSICGIHGRQYLVIVCGRERTAPHRAAASSRSRCRRTR